MATPQLHFKAHNNSFSVHISNLESLSVEQIQRFEEFTKSRKGIFDFQTYTFYIQKRVGYSEFVTLLKMLEIDAYVSEVIPRELQKPRVPFGQYKGLFYSDVPDSYLMWLVANHHGSERQNIENERKSRGL